VNEPLGTLFVVATPIGNIDDISLRARKVLADAEIVAAEDTRHSGRLLERLGIDSRLVSCHEHNETARIPQLLECLAAGNDVALISDAGTPLVSDPGFRLVNAVVAKGFRVCPVPGCNAAIAAASISALPTDQLLFVGFLPASSGKRQTRLHELENSPATLLIYESVHRIKPTLRDIQLVFGAERQMVAARELTKLHETIYRGSVVEVLDQIVADSGGDKGEFTLVIAGADAPVADDLELDRVLKILLGFMGVRQSSEAAAALLSVRKRVAYQRALELREDTDSNY
jgi:16S rRNA (cytidine1402-2'-O)-methyltransferase